MECAVEAMENDLEEGHHAPSSKFNYHYADISLLSADLAAAAFTACGDASAVNSR